MYLDISNTLDICDFTSSFFHIFQRWGSSYFLVSEILLFLTIFALGVCVCSFPSSFYHHISVCNKRPRKTSPNRHETSKVEYGYERSLFLEPLLHTPNHMSLNFLSHPSFSHQKKNQRPFTHSSPGGTKTKSSFLRGDPSNPLRNSGLTLWWSFFHYQDA
ncbi:hypothetical protein TWF679_008373 [Orbilia oligospora]|uniref:Uncharacterized protein n=1 Tax=Orbilia oligospora TaxID=2813651 RepID=A0A8H8V5J4_ORBOL|nr:hypothetical protein TWF679_008373 [Orbilia oligospora]